MEVEEEHDEAAKFWLQFQPPEDPGSNGEVLEALFAALQAPATSHHLTGISAGISFSKRGDGLILSLFDKGADTDIYYFPANAMSVDKTDNSAGDSEDSEDEEREVYKFTMEERNSIVDAVKRCPYLKALSIEDVDNLGMMVIEELLSGPSHLQRLKFGEDVDMNQWREAEVAPLVKCIQRIHTLEELAIMNSRILDGILLHLFPHGSQDGTLKGLRIIWNKNWAVDKLDEEEGIRPIVNLLTRNAKLTTLDLSYTQFPIRWWLKVFEALRENNHLANLLLRYSTFRGTKVKAILEGIMDVLHVNFSLQEIDLTGTELERDGSAIIVKAQLKTQGLHKIMDSLGSMKPTGARVFLCGFPYAGKSQLCETMGKMAKKKKTGYIKSVKDRLISAVHRGSLIKRTTGIEVEVLQLETDVQISVWDLAGQDEYHAFHDLFISDGYKSACSFVIVCSLINCNAKGKFKEDKDMEHELNYWLRFIASNSTISQNVTPHVTLVFSHEDYVKKEYDIRESTKVLVQELGHKYEGTVEISPNHFFVNARSKTSVQELATFLAETVKKLLSNSPNVYRVCHEVQSALQVWNCENPTLPLIRWTEFVNYLQEQIATLKAIGKYSGSHLQDVSKAIALALHDIGDVIFIERLDFIVVNPVWFCREIMGRILCGKDMCHTIFKGKPVTDTKGFIERKVLQSILDGSYVDGTILKRKIVKKKNTSQVGVPGEDLIQLMKVMDLCFEGFNADTNEHGLFIPATLREKIELKSQWQGDSSHSNYYYLGRRLECKDQLRTFLTNGFFPRLQVAFMAKFSSTVQCHLGQNMILLRADGKNVLVQYLGEYLGTETSNQYIDILVKSSKQQAKTMAFTRDHIVQFIRENCYKPTFGCPGVILIESILNPEYVENHSQIPRDQAVIVEELRNAVTSERSLNLDYCHEWPHPGSNNKAKDLLGDEVWQELVKKWQVDVEFEANQQLKVLKGYQLELNKISNPSDNQQRRNYDSTSLDLHQDAMLKQLEPQQATLFKLLKDVGDKREVNYLHRLDSLESNLSKKYESIAMLQMNLYEEFSWKLDKLKNVMIHSQQRQVPRLLYLTSKDVSTREWLITRLTPDMTAAQVHFMCEHKKGIHPLKTQEGLPLVIAGDTAQRILPYVNSGLQVITMLAKIGGVAFSGVSALVEHLGKAALDEINSFVSKDQVFSGLEEPNLPKQLVPRELNIPLPTKTEGRHAEQWLFDTLRGKDLAKLFDLHRVVYNDGSDNIAWVCGQHYKEGCHGIASSHTMQPYPV